ncbi:hypothetical protein Tco_0553891 [Tanacetum coccineum]
MSIRSRVSQVTVADIVMSDSEDSTITYTEVSSPYEDLSDTSSPGVMVYRYDGLPMHPPSPDYVPGPKEPEQAPPSPLRSSNCLLLSLPVPSPTGYITDSNPEEDLEEDLADYPVDRGDDDDDDDDDDESSDDDDDVEEDEEEEEHPTPADSIPPPVHRVTARMSVRAQTPISLPSDT